MNKMMMNVLMVLSIGLAVYAMLHMGIFLFQTLVDVLGYSIYVGVFTLPAIYFYHKLHRKNERND